MRGVAFAPRTGGLGMFKNRIFALIVAGLSVGLVATVTPAVAQDGAEGLQAGTIEYFTMSDSPYSGPVETIVNSAHPAVYQGSFTDVFLVVQNHSNVDTVTVNIELELAYADGRPVRPFHLGADRIHTLGPDEGVGFLVFFEVPADAAVGTATFRAKARVGRTGADGHADNPNPMIAEDGVEFEVVPR